MLPGDQDKIRFLKLYAVYEDIIYRFSKGYDEDYRDSLNTYASPIILALKGVLSLDEEATINMFSDNKRYGVVFKSNSKDLIEFRTPNMTSNPVLWQNYINTFCHLLMYSADKNNYKKELDEYIDKFSKIYILEYYNLENKNKALELARDIFPQSVDRINFMHQYLKR